MILQDLHIPVEVGLLDDIGHAGFDELETFCSKNASISWFAPGWKFKRYSPMISTVGLGWERS